MKRAKVLDFGAEHDDFLGFMPDDGHDINLYYNLKKEDIDAGVKTATALKGLWSKRDSHPSCGKKPRNLGFLNKKKRKKYDNCLTTYANKQIKANKEIEIARIEADANAKAGQGGSGGSNANTGMSMGAKIGIAVGSLVLVGGIIFAATR